jgi:PAS domain S-box-containing protein
MRVVRDLLASDAIGLVVLDFDGRICEWSPGATKIFGWTDAEVIGSLPDFLMTSECWAAHRTAMRRLDDDPKQHEQTLAIDGWCYSKEEGWVPVHIVVAGFHNHVDYYHIALFSRRADFRQMPTMPQPESHVRPVNPPTSKPQPRLPGIYHAFTD